MKKLMLLGAFALFGAMNVNAQTGFKLGAHAGLPLGDAGDAYSFTAGVDLSYMWAVGEGFNLGVATGYSAWFGKSYDIPGYGSFKPDTLGLIPVAASAQYNFTPEFSLGVDLGYGIFTNEGADGGFYYQPKAAYHFGPSEVNLAYQGVSNDGSISAITLGYAYSFGK